MIKDIEAMLELDPRARAIRFTAKGSEIVLVGSIGSPEDLYELARRGGKACASHRWDPCSCWCL